MKAWDAPVLLTGSTLYNANEWPALSADGQKVVYDCAAELNTPQAICELRTDGAQADIKSPTLFASSQGDHPQELHHPDYGSGDDVIFEGAGGGEINEAIWRLTRGGAPQRISEVNNDNSPCYLTESLVEKPIVSVFVDDIHEIKVMSEDGRRPMNRAW